MRRFGSTLAAISLATSAIASPAKKIDLRIIKAALVYELSPKLGDGCLRICQIPASLGGTDKGMLTWIKSQGMQVTTDHAMLNGPLPKSWAFCEIRDFKVLSKKLAFVGTYDMGPFGDVRGESYSKLYLKLVHGKWAVDKNRSSSETGE